MVSCRASSKTLVGVAIDKQNRVYTTEQEPGRLQVFRYVTDSEAAAEKTKHEEELQKAADRRQKASSAAPDNKGASPNAGKPAEAKPD